MTIITQARERCQAFANTHKLVFEDHGECGFGRPCVGLLRGDSYVAYNPTAYVFKPGDLNPSGFKRVEGFYDRRLGPPASVTDAYHKDDCMAVLVKSCGGCENDDEPRQDHYNAAILQLADWVDHLERIGVEVAEYATGAQGIHAVVHGTVRYALRSTDGNPWLRGQPMPDSMRQSPATPSGAGGDGGKGE